MAYVRLLDVLGKLSSKTIATQTFLKALSAKPRVILPRIDEFIVMSE